MTDKTISVTMNERDITRISIFLENANQRFKSSNIIKNYEELNLFYTYIKIVLLEKTRDIKIYRHLAKKVMFIYLIL